jgi:hypothetical protein
MKFDKLDSKDLIVRVRGDDCNWFEYGLISEIGNSLRYYPLDFYNRSFYFYYGSNRWLGQVTRSELRYPRKYKYRYHKHQLKPNKKEIENAMEKISNLKLEKKVKLYSKYVVLPFVISKWKNRVWPIDIKYLNKKQNKSRKYFLKHGDFS